MKNIVLFSKFNVCISEENWNFMCENRWGTYNPPLDIVEAEFGICGMRDAASDEEASKIAEDTVNALREISGFGIEKEPKDFLETGVNDAAYMDDEGKIYIEKE